MVDLMDIYKEKAGPRPRGKKVKGDDTESSGLPRRPRRPPHVAARLTWQEPPRACRSGPRWPPSAPLARF